MRRAVLTFLTISCLSYQVAGQKKQPEPYNVAEVYEVYAEITPSEWPVTIAKAKRLVIRAETISYEMCLKPEPESAALVGPAIANYVELNRNTFKFQVLKTVVPVGGVKSQGSSSNVQVSKT